MAWAQPTRFVTLTQAPESWQPLRQKMRKLTLRVREEGYRTEWAWTVERGSRTGMIHIHALQHGDYLPQRSLEKWWGRRVDIRKVHDTDGAARYTTKHAAARVVSYTMKGTREALQLHLDLNGGRGVHTSRGYLHGLRSDEVWRRLHPPSGLNWVMVPFEYSDEEALQVASTVS